MAFVRSWAEGVDLVSAWSRFVDMDGSADARRARGELRRLRDQLGGLARRHGRPEIAALLRRDPEAMTDTGAGVPTLEAFAARQPPDYYSESELVALYEAEFGRVDARSSARRRQRLRERLVAALLWLEQVGVRAPQPGDPVATWLDERVAARLAAAGLHTLADLHGRVRSRGFHWHRGIARVGPGTAARVVAWLREHAATLGDLPSPALVPPRQLDTRALTPAPRTALVPLERFVAPADRDGSQGTNRAAPARCRIGAANDQQAIDAWLRLRSAGSHTWRAYRKEAERFLLWAVLARGKALSSLDGSDCLAYREFLAAPDAAWTGARGAQRWSPAWRPFEGPLSARSQASATTIVRGLCAWLQRQHYLATNPWDDVPRGGDTPLQPPLRAFTDGQWMLLQHWLQGELEHVASPALLRLRFLLDFGSMTGLRLAELADARLGGLRAVPLPDGAAGWWLQVAGASGVRGAGRAVPLPDAAMQALRDHLVQRGLPTDPLACDPRAPLIARLTSERPLSGARIYAILSDAFTRCAHSVQRQDAAAAARIRMASTRWLRHTFGRRAIAGGAPPAAVQAVLGHASPAATAVYLEGSLDRAHEAIQVALAKSGAPGAPAPRRTPRSTGE